MISAVEREHPDMLIHLGDLERDAEDLGFAYPLLPLVHVPGNCDGWSTTPLKKLITVQGRRILLSHGHIWQVKQGYATALSEARKAQANLLLFGHTHRAYCQQEEDGLWVLNPGASTQSYGVLLLQEGELLCSITQLP